MQHKIDQYISEINSFTSSRPDELETFRIRFLGTKGIIKDLFEEFKTVTAEEKRVLGKVLNEFKQSAELKYSTLKEEIENAVSDSPDAKTDLTLPGEGLELGSRHPLSLVRKEIIEIFKKLGLYFNLKKRKHDRPLAKWMIELLGLNKVR